MYNATKQINWLEPTRFSKPDNDISFAERAFFSQDDEENDEITNKDRLLTEKEILDIEADEKEENDEDLDDDNWQD